MTFKILIKSLIVNLFLAILKIIASFLTNSKTLLADAVHGLSDMSTDLVGLTGAKIASKKPDQTHPYGHGKMEYLTSIFISLFVIFLGLMIFFNSFSVREINYSKFILFLMPLTIIMKYILSSYLIKNGKKLNSSILISNGIESRFDSINTAFALLILVISFFQKYFSILKYADMFGSIIISFFTIKVGFKIFFKNTKSVIGEIDINPEKIKLIKENLSTNKKIIKIDKVTLLKYGCYYNLTVDLKMDRNLKLNKIYKEEKSIKEKLKKEFNEIKYVTINIKPSKIKKEL